MVFGIGILHGYLYPKFRTTADIKMKLKFCCSVWHTNHLVVNMRHAIVVVSDEIHFLFVYFQAVKTILLRIGGDVIEAE
jgi:hypothetical protein